MFKRSLKPLFAAMLIATALSPVRAQLAQEPLLNRPNSVAPNLVLILDTSGSMDANYIYQWGGTGDAFGMPGPSTKTYAQFSPDVNRLYYDPRVRYRPRVDYLGNPMAVNAPSSGWEVYFRITSGAYTSAQLGSLSDYYNPSYAPPVMSVVFGSTASYPNKVTAPMISGGALFPKFINRTDCVTNATSCTASEEAQNHSNWNKWYTTRLEMTKTGLGAAFRPLKDDSIRLGYGTISQIDGGRLQQGVGSYASAPGGVKDTFFNWLYGLRASSSTPNLTAVDNTGKYYSRTDSDGPWATLPNPSSTGISTVTASGPGKAEPIASHASCRRSFSMLVTDGYWNGTQPSTAGNADNTGFSIKPAVGPNFVYTPGPPYADGASNTLADIAMYYWGRDLRADLANRVPVINSNGINNPSTWQNVSFYAVTLGIDGTLPHTAAMLANLTSGATSWPTPTANTPTTIDDTWHATINGRGELLNASNATELTAGLNKMFTTIAGLPKTLSGVAVSTTFLKNGTRKYKPEYVPGTWSGRLSAIELDPLTGNDKVPQHTFWQVERGPNSAGGPISSIPAPSLRNVVTWNGSTAVTFDATNTGLTTDLIAYLRGDATNELRNAGTLRNREAVLGDIVNSSPAFILNNLDMSYEKLLPANSFGDYRAFVANKAARTEGVLFVGANDGMLHGFRDSTGVETFAFVPQAVVPNLAKLAVTPYVHQYYVDGPNTEADAYLNGVWKNLLLSTAGAGAKSVFAFDVTNPLTMTAANVLWEVNSTTTNFANLGNVLSEVQAGILLSGDWVAIFGNGFSSTSGVASLFVVNLQTGRLIQEIRADISGGNGLGGVRVVRDANQRIIGAYAGDLKGNMWKFDLSSTTSGTWKVGLSNGSTFSPLYAAGATQPITAAPAVLPHPNGGYVVAFGTGKFVEAADAVAPYAAQTLYGVWDAQPFGATTTPTGAAVTGLTSLLQQSITAVSVGTPAVTYYRVSTNKLTWGNGLTGTRGWYINLPNSGERLVYPEDRLAGTFILASTLSPVSSAAADLCVQTGSGSGWAYVLDGLTGSGPTKPTLDTNGDGIVDANDALVSGWQDPVDGRPTPITIESTTLKDSYCIVTAQNTCTEVELTCGQVGAKACPTSSSSVSGLKSREWRQLFMR